MNVEIAIVLGILGIAFLLFVSEKFTVDKTAFFIFNDYRHKFREKWRGVLGGTKNDSYNQTSNLGIFTFFND